MNLGTIFAGTAVAAHSNQLEDSESGNVGNVPFPFNSFEKHLSKCKFLFSDSDPVIVAVNPPADCQEDYSNSGEKEP